MSKKTKEKRLQFTRLLCDINRMLIKKLEVDTEDAEDAEDRRLGKHPYE